MSFQAWRNFINSLDAVYDKFYIIRAFFQVGIEWKTLSCFFTCKKCQGNWQLASFFESSQRTSTDVTARCYCLSFTLR